MFFITNEITELTLDAFLTAAFNLYSTQTKPHQKNIEDEVAAIGKAEAEIDLLNAKIIQSQNAIASSKTEIEREETTLLETYTAQKQAYLAEVASTFNQMEKLQTSMREFDVNQDNFKRALEKVSGAFAAVEQQNNQNARALEDLIEKHQLKKRAVVFDFDPVETGADSYAINLTLPNSTANSQLLNALRYTVDQSYNRISQQLNLKKDTTVKETTTTYSLTFDLPILLTNLNYIRAELIKHIEEKMHASIKEAGIQFAFLPSYYDKMIGLDMETTAEYISKLEVDNGKLAEPFIPVPYVAPIDLIEPARPITLETVLGEGPIVKLLDAAITEVLANAEQKSFTDSPAQSPADSLALSPTASQPYAETIESGLYVFLPKDAGLRIDVVAWKAAVIDGKALLDNGTRYIHPLSFEAITGEVLEEGQFELTREMYSSQPAALEANLAATIPVPSGSVALVAESLEAKVATPLIPAAVLPSADVPAAVVSVAQVEKPKDMETRRVEYIKKHYFKRFNQTATTKDLVSVDIMGALKQIDQDIGIQLRDEMFYRNQVNNGRNNNYSHILSYEKREGTIYYQIDSAAKFVDHYIHKQLFQHDFSKKDPVTEALKLEDSLGQTTTSTSASASIPPRDTVVSIPVLIDPYRARSLSFVEKLFFSDITAETIAKQQLVKLLRKADNECWLEEDIHDVTYAGKILTSCNNNKLENKNDTFARQQAIAFILDYIQDEAKEFADFKDIVKHQLAKEDAEEKKEAVHYFTGIEKIATIDLLFAMRSVDRDLTDERFYGKRTKQLYQTELEQLITLRLTTEPNKPNSYQQEKDDENPAVYAVQGAIDVINTYYNVRRILKDNKDKDDAFAKNGLLHKLAGALNIDTSAARLIAQKDEALFKFDPDSRGSVSQPRTDNTPYSTIKVLQYAAYRANRLS